MPVENIYSSAYVKALFDEMAQTYGPVNLISSFGFAKGWRDTCIREAGLQSGMTVYDWMSGMGECWASILAKIGSGGQIAALDISPVMCAKSMDNRAYHKHGNVTITAQDVLENHLPDESADCVISTFGLKTFDTNQQHQLAGEIWRVLKPRGTFSLLEISVPKNPLLRVPYLFYIKTCIPLIGRLWLGNPDNYRMLGRYTTAFRNCTGMQTALEQTGFLVQFHTHFFGCATSVSGQKPIRDEVNAGDKAVL